MPTLFKSSTPTPVKIQNKFYKHLREFTAWAPWGTAPDHSKLNDDYIRIKGPEPKQFDYPAALQELINQSWKAAATPTTARGDKFAMSRHRTRPQDTVGAPSPLRAGFRRPINNDWGHIKQFKQVAAYAFRGDYRTPEAIQAAGGFFPPSSRTDDFYINAMAREFCDYMTRKGLLEGVDQAGKQKVILEVEGYLRGRMAPTDRKLFAEVHFWRQVMQREEMHLRAMTNNSFLKAYISTTRDIKVAREGASGILGGAGANTGAFGWIYVLRVRSGFLLKKGVGGIIKEEGEIAHLGPIKWEDVIGFIGIHPVEKQIYLRNMFDQQEFEAFKLVLATLSTQAR